MGSTIAVLKGVLRVRKSETKWRIFWLFKRLFTSEHGMAGHDRIALAERGTNPARVRRSRFHVCADFCAFDAWFKFGKFMSDRTSVAGIESATALVPFALLLGMSLDVSQWQVFGRARPPRPA
jgi:hypothetical protein